MGEAFDPSEELQRWLLSCPLRDDLPLARGNRFPPAHRGHPGRTRGHRVEAGAAPMERGD